VTTADCFVSVVAPVFNEAGILEGFIAELSAVLRAQYEHYEILLVDDGSRDDTAARAAELLSRYDHVRLVSLSRRFGLEVAISAGLDLVIGDFVVVMLPDSDPPALVPEMVRRCREGAGVVFGVRTNRRGESLPVRVGARAFYWLCRRVFGFDLPRNSTEFRALSRQAVNAITQIKDRYRYLRVFSSYIGYASQSVPYEPICRSGRPRVKRLFEAVSLAISLVAANSTSPLRLAGRLAFAAAAANVAYLGYIVLVYLFKEHVMEGWTTLSLVGVTMFACLFLVIATMCEYLARLLDESKDRPLYFIRDEQTSDVLLTDTNRRNVVSESRPAP
jgi:dolichol-phosphate mannosyltransferase